MTFKDLIAFKHLTISELSRISNVPYSTINDITNGKSNLLDCTGKTLKALSIALKVKLDDLLELEDEEPKTLLPPFLNLSIKNYRKAIRKNDINIDCYSDDLRSSINIAEVENLISVDLANELRRRYF